MKKRCILGVNALNGLLSFLLKTGGKKYETDFYGCQRPKRAFIISTKSIKCKCSLSIGVNALNGLLSFLRCGL